MRTKILVLFTLFVSIASYTQEETGLKVYTFSEIDSLSKQRPKPIAVFIYTDWCKICYGMKETTFKNKKVIQLLNDNFYFVKLNGEEKKDITVLGKTFVYKPTGTNTGVHELTKELATTQKRISYPTTTFLNSKFVIQLQINGVYSAKKMEEILSRLSKN
jgi:thioredoxin-related protein